MRAVEHGWIALCDVVLNFRAVLFPTCEDVSFFIETVWVVDGTDWMVDGSSVNGTDSALFGRR